MASSLAGRGRLNAYVSVAASQTDSAVVAAFTGKRIRVIAAALNQGDTTPSTVTFTSKPAGSGVAISLAFKGAANALLTLPDIDSGWFQTVVGEGLSVTTGAGSTTGVLVVYEVVS